ncbi:flavodoxin domain-containing protein [Dictyobacter kobayashii]|uniref:Flavodoxin n=1 Tax=Dictyobacter kobayashii TaxID=2014872 RepID=A0A402AYT0_9CHLR|nr:flavodoxin domain-containing protein [Dictyobacter kobayashii]GCE24223.1 flavodoxin [Dictyobacter kobayashii]
MSGSILVAYATRYGSTQEVAETMAATLRERGFEVDLQPAQDVKTLAGYQAIILGAPIFMSRWHKDARHFLTRHSIALATLPVAIFALGPTHADEKEFQEARQQLDTELAQFSWLTAYAVEIFGGKFDPAKFNIPYTLLPVLKNIPASDVRDWDAIRAWTSKLPAKLLWAPAYTGEVPSD